MPQSSAEASGCQFFKATDSEAEEVPEDEDRDISQHLTEHLTEPHRCRQKLTRPRNGRGARAGSSWEQLGSAKCEVPSESLPR